MATTILKPVYLVDALGEYANIPNGAVINIGGVSGPTFTVAGKPLLFADGTSTDGSPVGNITIDLQTVYTNSVGSAFIDFTIGKDLVFQAKNGKQFRFNANTGLVTITGDLTVHGTTTAIINTSVTSDKVWINQTAGDYVPFHIEPLPGVTPTLNLAEVRTSSSGQPVFAISPAGITSIENLLVAGTINGIDIATLQQQLLDHVNINTAGIRHTGKQISVNTTGLAPVTGTNVQAALESISTAISSLIGSNIRAFEHVQLSPSAVWTINHNQNSRRIQFTVWDNTDELIFADTVTISDNNTVIVTYNTPITGRAVLMLF